MILRRRMGWSVFLRRNMVPMVVTLVYVTLVTVLDEVVHLDIAVPVSVAALLGTVLSILLGFRTNSAYQRWWEARKVWGSIVNDSRTFARQVLTILRAPDGDVAAQGRVRALQQEMIYRQIAWNYTLGHALRRKPLDPSLSSLLPPEEVEAMATQSHPHAYLLQRQGERLGDALDAGTVDSVLFLAIDKTLTRFSDWMGMCERIKTTVFPTQYSYFIHQVAWLFVLLFPLSMVDHMGWLTLPVAFFVGQIFVIIDTIAEYLQNPFECLPTDTPMTAIARTIEINLRQQLGETDLPAPMEPVDGVLM